MKKLITVLLLAVLCMGLSAPALAEVPSYEVTKSFVAVLEKNELAYEFEGKISNGEERISMFNRDENFSYTINIFFDEDNDQASVYVWNIITFADEDFANVLRVVNELNYSYKYIRFYADETDNTVTCAMNMILHDNDEAGDIILEGLLRIASILKVAYPPLGVYNVE